MLSRFYPISLLHRSSQSDSFASQMWTDSSGMKTYPTEEDFSQIIHDSIRLKLNISLTKDQLQRFTRLRTHHVETDPSRRELEMENVWTLTQDNAYVMTILFENRGVFPQLIGTCGTFYATEYVRPIETPRSVLALSDSKPEWAKRVKLAAMILDLLQELDKVFPQPMHLCDIRINHFGLPFDGEKVKFLDLDHVFLKSAIDAKVMNNKECDKHEDCDFFDCRSFCSKRKRCEMPVVNNNLQVSVKVTPIFCIHDLTDTVLHFYK